VRKAAGAAYRTLRDDTSFRHTTYQMVPGSDGKVARKLARDEKHYERHLRRKTRNWAALSDEQGRDADAPKLSEAERHAGGYDTQYGMTDRLGSTVIETTPEGNVVTHLVSRKYAKAFPAGVTDEDGNNPVKAAFGAAQGEVQGAVQGAQDGQRQALPAPIGSPEGVIKGGGKLQMKARKYAPMPYWRMIGRKGPQAWHAGKKLKVAEQQFDSLPPQAQEKLVAQMKKSAWWRKQHAKRVAAAREQETAEERAVAVRGPAAPEESHAEDKAVGLRGRGSMQALAQQVRTSGQQQKLAAAAPRRHKGMAESLGEVIAVGACSALGIAC